MASQKGSRAHYSSFSSSSTTLIHTFKNETTISDFPEKVTEIPIQSPLSEDLKSSAAVRIQSVYRAYAIRSLVKKIRAVNSQANYWENFIQRQETVDAVRSNARERIKINEALMALLFRLDSVPGFNPSVRDLRRHVSRRIVGLQEILDAIADTRIENWDGFLSDWDDVLAGIEKEACKERGGGQEMERFCAEHLGFRCLQRFLQDI